MQVATDNVRQLRNNMDALYSDYLDALVEHEKAIQELSRQRRKHLQSVKNGKPKRMSMTAQQAYIDTQEEVYALQESYELARKDWLKALVPQELDPFAMRAEDI